MAGEGNNREDPGRKLPSCLRVLTGSPAIPLTLIVVVLLSGSE